MNSKQRMLNALHGERSDINPVALHAWGLYKFSLAGILSDYKDERKAWNIGGEELANIETSFYETFRPDWLHLSEGPYFMEILDRINDEKYSELLKEVRALESRESIDDLVDNIYLSEDELSGKGKFDHVRILSEKYGDEVFIALHTQSPFHDICDEGGILGFENTMIALQEKPYMLTYLAERVYEKQLSFVKALKKCGAHCYIHSEGYMGADIISPKTYEKLFYNIQKNFVSEVKKTGLIPMFYFSGNVFPLLDLIKNIGIKGLLIEESKKSMKLDVGEIMPKLNGRVALFGNVDGIDIMLKGKRQEIEIEVKRQIERANSNYFIINTGSPIAFDTPVQNIKSYIDAARNITRK